MIYRSKVIFISYRGDYKTKQPKLPDCIVKFISQGLLDCTDISKEIYDLATKGEVEEVLLPVLGWVPVLGLLCLLAGGICLGCYFYSRFYISDRILLIN